VRGPIVVGNPIGENPCTPRPCPRRPGRHPPGAAVLYLWDLSASGYANDFYAAAVQAGTQSWKAWLFGSLDSGSAITVDKPPAALWLMTLSARLFGFNSWSLLVPGRAPGGMAGGSGGQGGVPGGTADSTSSQIAEWVAANHTATTVGSQTVYDLQSWVR
jgi:hypothetical protein